MSRHSLSIGVRLAFGCALLGLVALGGATAAYLSQEGHAARAAEVRHAADAGAAIERMRVGIYAVVMESRGLYLARDRRQAEGFATGLRRHLADMEAAWADLRAFLPPAEAASAATLERPFRDFVALRTELARIGVEQGREAANTLGNNDANRANRTAFSDALDAFAVRLRGTVDRMEAEATAASRRAALATLGLTAIAVLGLTGGMLWLVRRQVARPLAALSTGLEEMAAGRPAAARLPEGGVGEVGRIVAAAQVFRERLAENGRLAEEAAAARAERDRAQAAMDRHTQDFGAATAGVMARLGDDARGMQEAARNLAQLAAGTHARAADTASGAEASVRDLAAVAAATEELAASVGEIGRQVSEASAAVRDAVGRAEATAGTVRGLTDAAGQVEEVVRLISDIAGQTNLLALNATIEAARAGEAGKGFAVVAGEVKALAGQTATATGRIAGQVQAIQAATAGAVAAVAGVAEAIARVDSVAAAIAGAVEQQGGATREIAASVQSVVSRTEATATAMQGFCGGAEEGGRQAEALAGIAADAGRKAAAVEGELGQFLDALRGNASERRLYERIQGGGRQVELRPAGGTAARATLADIARGGATLHGAPSLPGGTELTLGIEGHPALPARVARTDGGTLAVAFRQDQATLASVDRMLAVLSGAPAARAA